MQYPFMDAPIKGATPYRRVTTFAYNRTGAASVVKSLYQFDTSFTASGAEASANSKGLVLPAVISHNWGDLDGCWMNVVKTSFTDATDGNHYAGAFCVCLESVGDNELMEVLICGETEILSLGTSAISYRAGALIVPGSADEATNVLVTRVQSTAKHLGWTTETKAQDTVTPSYVKCFFNGLSHN